MSAASRKVVGDLRSDLTRTVLVALAIAVGVTALGMVLGARALMQRTLDASAREGAFASATFRTDDFPPLLLAGVRAVPGVVRAEARRVADARVSTGGGTWDDLTLIAVPDYRRLTIDRIAPQRGAWPPPFRQVLLERDSLAHMHTSVGGRVLLDVNGVQTPVRVAGTVHDLSNPSTSTSGTLYGYVSFATLHALGDRGGLDELDIATPPGLTRAQVERIATRVREVVELSGLGVSFESVPKPGKFWADDAVQSMVMLLSVLAVVGLAMSALLVVNVVSALLAQHVRQIGIMKAIGSSARRAAAMYLATATVFGLLALALAIPLGALGALLIVKVTTQLIDVDTPSFSIPPSVLAIEIAVGLVLPALAALAPVLAASKTTVRDAMSRDRLGTPVASGGVVERLTLPAAVRLSLRNAVRGRRRLGLTLVGLVVGGAVFVALVSVRASLASTLTAENRYRQYDVEIALDHAYPEAAVERAAAGPGVARVQAWANGAGYRIRPDGSQSQTLALVGLPPHTSFVRPIVLHGSAGGVLVNTDVLRTEHDLHVGSTLVVSVKGRRVAWRVAGIAKAILSEPTIYAPRALVAAATHERRLARTLAVVTTRHDADGEKRLAHLISTRLERAGFRVGSVQTTQSIHAVDASNFDVISSFLIAMAILIAAVAGLGLMGTLSVNVLERARELGVLRAVGARNGAVMRLVVVEGLVISLLGWLVATPLAVPLSTVLAREVGNLFIGTPLVYSFPPAIPFLWLAIVAVAAAVAATAPALRAARMTVRDALAYE